MRKIKKDDTTARTKTIGEIVYANTFTLFNVVNVALAVCVALVHSYKNMLFLGVAVWNTVIGMYQQIHAKRVLDRLTFISQGAVWVLRGNEDVQIPKEQVQVGDSLILKSGTQICFDGQVTSGSCQVNESMLTGESRWITKNEGDKVLAGSYVVSGYAIGQVMSGEGDNYIDKIAVVAHKEKKVQSEILKSVKFIIKIVTILLFPVAVLSFAKQYVLLEEGLQEATVSTVAAVIGMIPSGFVLLTSIVMAVASLRLAKKNTLVQDMYCIEMLARADVLCLDKTGTLTEGHLQVEERLDVEKIRQCEIASFCNNMQDKNATLRAIEHAYTVKSSGESKAESKPEVYSESGELKHKETMESAIQQDEMLQSVCHLEFSSERKWSLNVLEGKGTYLLGAYDVLFADKQDEKWITYIEEKENAGKRVLAFAFSPTVLTPQVVQEDMDIQKQLPDLRLCSLFVIGDIIRTQVKETLEFFRENDVDIRILSGDHPVTVSQIARECGMKDYNQYVDMSQYSELPLQAEWIDRYKIFGRVSPTQKQQIIKLLKQRGHKVAMTGDGVNDVMALKEADCSIAMQSGSEAARNVSQLVLLDSEFKTMPDIVKEGRRSIQNLQRSSTLYLVKTIYSILMAMFFLFATVPYPFVPIQLTLLGALSIGIPSFVLAMEPNFDRIKGKFLYNILVRAIPGGLLVFANIMIMLFVSYVMQVSEPVRESMVYLAMIVASMTILFYLCVPFTFVRTVLFTIISCGFFVAISLFGNVFEVVRLSGVQLVILAIVFVVDLLLSKVFKYFTDQKRKGEEHVICT